jgi:hypothetical protein
MPRPSHKVSFSSRHRNYTTRAQRTRNRTRRALGQTPYRATRNSSSEKLAKNLLPQINKTATASRATRRTTLALSKFARTINQQTRARTAAAERAAAAPAREAARARTAARTAERATAKREAAAKRAAKRAAALEALQHKKTADAEAAAAAAAAAAAYEVVYMNDFRIRSEERQREKIAAAMARRAAEADAAARAAEADAAARAALEEVDDERDLEELAAAFRRM